MQPDGLVQLWIQGLVEDTREPAEFARAVTGINDRIAAGVPEVRASVELRRALDESTRGQLQTFMDALLEPPADVEPGSAAHELARAVARQGYPQEVLLRIYRTGQEAALRYIADVYGPRTEQMLLPPTALVEFWERVSGWLYGSLLALLPTYSGERDRLLQGAVARRLDAVQAILRGDPVDVDELSGVLGHRLRGHHLACVLWLDAPAPDAGERLEQAAARLARLLGGGPHLAVPAGERGLWSWVGSEAAHPSEAVAQLAERTPEWAGDGVRAAVGVPAPGLAGFRTSHREALAARELARPGRGLTSYADVEVASLCGGDAAAMHTFVARELGALAAGEPAVERLRETAVAYLAHGVNGAAEALSVHRNTVRYRLRQAEELLGRPLDRRRLEVELALRCIAAYGPGPVDAAAPTPA